MTRATWLVLAAWVAGFTVGTVFHLIELLTQGFDVYGSMPGWLRVFWVSLTVIDPFVVILLLLRSRAGIWLGCAVMVADVVVNWSVALSIPGATGPGLITQPLFLIFLLGTAPLLWKAFPSPAADPPRHPLA
ncbi:hypothetical protein [Agromyces sp. Marseille-Q5079]|uniref:hypothetical protein n=1 Tax=Agromyces sp. Marseille-Q5079 TaxID=3439059 RepID=UPI003D9CA9CC